MTKLEVPRSMPPPLFFSDLSHRPWLSSYSPGLFLPFMGSEESPCCRQAAELGLGKSLQPFALSIFHYLVRKKIYGRLSASPLPQGPRVFSRMPFAEGASACLYLLNASSSRPDNIQWRIYVSFEEARGTLDGAHEKQLHKIHDPIALVCENPPSFSSLSTSPGDMVSGEGSCSLGKAVTNMASGRQVAYIEDPPENVNTV